MLRGEDLCGGHQCGLIAVFDGDERSLHGYDCLAGADVALQQAAHRLGAAHVGCDLSEDPLLGGGGMEREHLLDCFAYVIVGRKRCADALAHAAALQLEAEFKVEELFEYEAAMCRAW